METNIGSYIKSARLSVGLGQREMARLIDVSPSYLNEIENSKRLSPSLDLLERIRSVLEVDDEKYDDLAALSRKKLPSDVYKYLFENNSIVNLVRTIRNLGLSDGKIHELKDLIASENCSAIVVAAGSGAQLFEIDRDTPYCMKIFNGKTVLEHQLDAYEANGVTQISVVRGFQKEKINLEGLKYYDNDDYENNNVLNSLFFAEQEIEGNVIISYSDIMFSSEVVKRLLGSNADIAIVVDVNLTDRYLNRDSKTIHDAENVIFDANLNVADIGKFKILPGYVFGEFIGMIKLSPRGAEVFKRNFNRSKSLFWDKPYQRAKTFQKAYITDFLKDMIELGIAVQAVIIEKGWQEIVTNEDFETAILILEN